MAFIAAFNPHTLPFSTITYFTFTRRITQLQIYIYLECSSSNCFGYYTVIIQALYYKGHLKSLRATTVARLFVLKTILSRTSMYISCLTTLLIFRAIFKPEAQIKRSIIPAFYRGGKIAIQKSTRFFCFLFFFTRTNATQLRRHVLKDVTFPAHILLQDPSTSGPPKAISSSQ